MVTYHAGRIYLATPATRPFSMDMIPDGAIPCDGIIRRLEHQKDPMTGGWVVRWLREVFH